MNQFYTEQQLQAMPLNILRNLDVQNKQDEQLVQIVVNRRLFKLPPSTPVYRKDVPDIQNQEQEKEWQAKIDERMAKLRPVQPLDPTAENFDPLKVEMADKAGEGDSIIVNPKNALQKRIEDAERIQEGAPVILGGGVSPRLTKSGLPDKRIKAK